MSVQTSVSIFFLHPDSGKSAIDRHSNTSDPHGTIMTHFSDDTIPYFSFDRPLTAGQIKSRLLSGPDDDRRSMAAWILREAAFADVWQFLRPAQVAEMLPSIERQLGRKKDFWVHIIRTWHELGRV